MYKCLLSLSVLTILSFKTTTLFGQHGICGFAEQQQKLHAENPQLAIDRANFLKQFAEVRTVNDKKRLVYVIPVVFHIIHEYGAENITDAQVENEMQILNEDYRKLNADTSEIVQLFKPIAADVMIEFRLARLDPYGNCTNGTTCAASTRSAARSFSTRAAATRTPPWAPTAAMRSRAV